MDLRTFARESRTRDGLCIYDVDVEANRRVCKNHSFRPRRDRPHSFRARALLSIHTQVLLLLFHPLLSLPLVVHRQSSRGFRSFSPSLSLSLSPSLSFCLYFLRPRYSAISWNFSFSSSSSSAWMQLVKYSLPKQFCLLVEEEQKI